MLLPINIICKDWAEYRKTILVLTAGMFLPLLFGGLSTDFARGTMAGVLIGASYGYAQFVFVFERQRGTLQLLLSLPVRPIDLVLAKYASLYSMVLFTINVPGIFFGDLRTLLLVNACGLIVSTICMTFTVISDKPWAPMIPLYVVLIFFMPVRTILERFYPAGLGLLHFLTSHLIWLAAFAIVLAPMIAVASAFWFHRRLTYAD